MIAETGAHLTNTIRSSPSLFEIISQENLGESLREAIEHVVKSLYPHRIIFHYFDEIYLLFDAVVQYHYIQTKGGTLSEAFYGLQRLSNQNFKKAYVPAIIIPYIQLKIKRFFIQLNNEFIPGEKSWRTILIKIYHYVTIILDILKFYYTLMYILGKNESHSLIFTILKLKLTYATTPSIQIQRNGLRWFLYTIGNGILPILEFGSFITQFLQTWNSQRGTSVGLPIPEFYDGNLKLDKTKCPLCFKTRQNSTALSKSGVVYCYLCITKYLKEIPKCPITGVPSHLNNLIRIYD